MTERTHAELLPRPIRPRVPRGCAGDIPALLRIFTWVLSRYVGGVLVEAIIVGIVSSLGYFLIGIEFWLPLGVIALVGEMVPIIGPWLAFLMSLPVILATQPDKAVLALGLFVAIQILDGVLLSPFIQGRSVQFPFVATLFIMVAGGAIAGPLGAILALPAAASLRAIFCYTSYRAGGLSPSAALGELPLFQREQAPRTSARGATALPPS